MKETPQPTPSQIDNTPSNLYATKLSPTLFEIIEAESKPRKLTSRLTKTVQVEVVKYVELEDGRVQTELVKRPKKVVMQQTTFQGGKVIGVLKYSYPVWRDLQLKIPADTLVRLTRTQADRIRKELA